MCKYKPLFHFVCVTVCVLTSWFECDIINFDVYCSAHQDRVLSCCKNNNKGTLYIQYVCAYTLRQRNTHTHINVGFYSQFSLE